MSAAVRAAALAFGLQAEPVLLARTTWRAGNLVLKPADLPAHWIALAELVEPLPRSSRLRVPYPARSLAGQWVAEGHVAWEYLPGEDRAGSYAEKLAACDAFDDLFAGIAKPAYLEARQNPWAIADRVAWGEVSHRYGPPFDRMVDEVRSALEAIDLPSQIVHGDVSGNMVFADGLPTGVIDLTPYWRPAGFTKAVLVHDAVAHESADPAVFTPLCRRPQFGQLVLRAGLRRICEQPEQIAAFGKPLDEAVRMARRCSAGLAALSLL